MSSPTTIPISWRAMSAVEKYFKHWGSNTDACNENTMPESLTEPWGNNLAIDAPRALINAVPTAVCGIAMAIPTAAGVKLER